MRLTEATIRSLGALALALCVLQSSKAGAGPAWVVAIDRAVAIAGIAPLERWAKTVSSLAGDTRAVSFERQAEAVSARRIKSELRAGRFACAALDPGALIREGAIYAAAEVPFLATDDAALARLFDRWRPMLERRLAEDGLALVMLLPGAPRGLLAPPGVRRLADLAALSVAAPGAAGARLVELIGARPAAEPADALFASRAAADRHARQMPAAVFMPLQGWRGAITLVCRAELLQSLPTPERAEVLAAALDIEDATWRPRGPDEIEPATEAKSAVDAPLPVAEPARGLVSGLVRIGAQMAREWAIAAGADGMELVAGLDQAN